MGRSAAVRIHRVVHYIHSQNLPAHSATHTASQALSQAPPPGHGPHPPHPPRACWILSHKLHLSGSFTRLRSQRGRWRRGLAVAARWPLRSQDVAADDPDHGAPKHCQRPPGTLSAALGSFLSSLPASASGGSPAGSPSGSPLGHRRVAPWRLHISYFWLCIVRYGGLFAQVETLRQQSLFDFCTFVSSIDTQPSFCIPYLTLMSSANSHISQKHVKTGGEGGRERPWPSSQGLTLG